MTSLPSRRTFAAPRRCNSVKAGQSVPITSTGLLLAAVAASMRTPRSPSGCRLRMMRCCMTSLRNVLWVASGEHHNVTGPMSAASEVAMARSVSRSWSTAAACAPIVGIRRVLTAPGIGAFARIAIETGLSVGIAVLAREPRRIGTEEISQAQSPHQKNRTQDALFSPAARRRRDASAEACRAAETPEA